MGTPISNKPLDTGIKVGDFNETTTSTLQKTGKKAFEAIPKTAVTGLGESNKTLSEMSAKQVEGEAKPTTTFAELKEKWDNLPREKLFNKFDSDLMGALGIRRSKLSAPETKQEKKTISTLEETRQILRNSREEKLQTQVDLANKMAMDNKARVAQNPDMDPDSITYSVKEWIEPREHDKKNTEPLQTIYNKLLYAIKYDQPMQLKPGMESEFRDVGLSMDFSDGPTLMNPEECESTLNALADAAIKNNIESIQYMKQKYDDITKSLNDKIALHNS